MFRIVFFAALFFVSFLSNGQSVVNTENNRLDSISDGFSGNIELGLNFVQNINNVFQTQNASQFQWKKNKHNIMSVNALNLTVFNDSKILNDGVQYLRYSYDLNKLLDIETFGQAQYNEIIKIKGRYLMGLGVRLHILDVYKDSVNLHFGMHYMREYEEETTLKINRHHRINNVLSFGWPINDKIDLNFISYYQPDVQNFKDFRVSTEASIQIEILKRLTFKYSMAWFYDENPPEGINRVFYNIRNTLLFDF
ncbi:MAG: DUF481 domain-containing protein [Brumimicrobium sp.]